MSVVIRGVRAAAITSGGSPGAGDQDFTVSGLGGLTPKAAIIIVTGATTNAVSTTHARMSFGYFDGTRYFTISTVNRHQAVTNTYCKTQSSNTRAVFLLDPAGGATDAEATASFIADGIRLNWSNFPATAVLVTVWLFAGTDVSACVGEWTASASVNTATGVVMANPFAPEVVMAMGAINSVHGVAANSTMIVGFARNSGGSPFVQGSNKRRTSDAINNSNSVNYVSTSNFQRFSSTVGNELTAFNADGFTATTRSGGGAYLYGYLALSFNGTAGHYIGTMDSSTTLGLVATTPTSFTPQFVLVLTSTATANNTALSTSDTGAGSWGINGFTANEMFSNSISDDDGATTAQNTIATESFSANDFRVRFDSAIGLPTPPAQPNAHIASFGGFAPGGWALSYSVVDPTVRKWEVLAIGVSVAASVPGLPTWKYNEEVRPLNPDQDWTAVVY